MDRMWSPWRSNYIESFKNQKDDEQCVFCTAQKGNISDEDSLLVSKDNLTFTILNLYPYNNGHLMVVPYRHISDLTELGVEESAEMMHKVQLCIKALTKVYKPHGFNFGANLGKAAGAGIDTHLHFHVVPRWNGDTNFMPALGEVKVISQDLLRTKQQLVEALAELDK